ncbi:hypothetical protein HOP50_13g68790 [Chloropicon primus]|nr:hypothetical protein A3770_13p68590 [Chloropicon primus]UPR03549.1 hypothetical protein HOP50_13g68790 [Chloropicon primus]|eukprot:QDZ24341.1 hypothetical protein A3770_13p68590 [Chloropicon primus]
MRRAFTLMAVAALALLPALAKPVAEPGLDQLALGDWQEGRATFYGNSGYNGDPYSIDQGHCMYGGIPSPRYIAALSIWEGFGGDWRYTNCGRCFEIKCREGPRYNCRSDRLNASLIVMVTDKCPCNRWCCGDAPHFDLSFWGFGEIGNHGGGVISTSWRPVECPENMGKGGELVLQPQEYEPFCQKPDSKDILAIAREKNLTTFAKALEVTNLKDDIEGRKRKYTVLAPTNDAFDRAANAFNTTVDNLLSKPFMREVMANHLVETLGDEGEARNSSNVRERLETLAGTTLNVTAGRTLRPLSTEAGGSNSGSEWLLIDQETLILEENVAACNGELDVVNKLVMPFKYQCKQDGAESLLALAKKRGLSTFLDAANGAGLHDLLSSLGKVTVFAPSNKAIRGMQKETRGANATAAAVDPRDFVFLGDVSLDNFRSNCSDVSLKDVELDDLKNITNCATAKRLGFCENPWVSSGYCPRSCGACRPKSELDVGFTIQSLNGDRMKVYPSADPKMGGKAPPFDLIVNGSLKITGHAEACNGKLYVLDDVSRD